MPGLTGGIWSVSSQKRGSFKLSDAAKRNAGREARLGVTENTHSALRMANTPSPAASEGAAASLPFAIPLQPTPKAHRSLSHSQGQRETPQASSVYPNQGSGGRALPMGLLAEDNETDEDEDSDFGGHLTHTVSHPPIGALQRAATYSAAYEDRLQVALSNLSIGMSTNPVVSKCVAETTCCDYRSSTASLSVGEPSRVDRFASHQRVQTPFPCGYPYSSGFIL